MQRTRHGSEVYKRQFALCYLALSIESHRPFLKQSRIGLSRLVNITVWWISNSGSFWSQIALCRGIGGECLQIYESSIDPSPVWAVVLFPFKDPSHWNTAPSMISLSRKVDPCATAWRFSGGNRASLPVFSTVVQRKYFDMRNLRGVHEKMTECPQLHLHARPWAHIYCIARYLQAEPYREYFTIPTIQGPVFFKKTLFGQIAFINLAVPWQGVFRERFRFILSKRHVRLGYKSATFPWLEVWRHSCR